MDPNVKLWSALPAANIRGAEEALAAGANVNLQNSEGDSPLHAAALRGEAPVVRLLLTHGAQVNADDDEGFTPLMVAALNGHTTVLKELLAGGANPNQTRLDTGETALHLAMNSNSRQVVTALLDAGVDVNAQTSNDKSTPLHVAAEFDNQRLARVLVGHPVCDILMKNSSGKTAAQVATDHDHHRLAEYLVMCSSPNSPVDQMLVSAILALDVDKAAEAVAAGANVNLQAPGGNTPLHAAALRGEAPIILLLLTHDGDVNKADDDGFTPLMVAALNGRLDAVKDLMAGGANPKLTRLDTGETALHMAMISNSREVVTALLDAGADVNAQTKDKSTPLHVAAEFNKQHLAEKLLKHPTCDATLEDVNGHTAAQVARMFRHDTLASMLGGADDVDSSLTASPLQEAGMTVQVVFGRPMPPGENVYKCTTNPKGHVLILNYEFTGTHNERRGSTTDVKNLNNVFTQMGYRVTTHKDLNKQESIKALEEFRNNEELGKVDSVFVCVLSHGEDKETFYTADNKTLTVNEVRNMFTDNECPNLKGKPKVFLMNFCRGKKKEKGCIIDKTRTDSVMIPRSPEHHSDSTDSVMEVPRDMFTFYATVEGIMALRNVYEGTFFVQALCQILAAYAHRDHLSELALKVRNHMVDRMCGTTPDWEDYFFKKFYLNPTSQTGR
ncbi:ankyrin-3-like [Homarus americanus]|nr:ankyrin-3-like [Homarus americanus]